MDEGKEVIYHGPVCFYCGHQVVWNNDFSGEDCGYSDREYDDGTVEAAEDQIVSFWTCPHCGAEYEVLLGPGPEKIDPEEEK